MMYHLTSSNHNTYNIKQNINNNIHISKVNNNFNYPINDNNFFNNNNYSNNCCCPSCGEPAGKNFKGSGSDYESFICLKCGNHQSVANYYKCNIHIMGIEDSSKYSIPNPQF